jgi:hypothetical protein
MWSMIIYCNSHFCGTQICTSSLQIDQLKRWRDCRWRLPLNRGFQFGIIYWTWPKSTHHIRLTILMYRQSHHLSQYFRCPLRRQWENREVFTQKSYASE